MAEQAKKILVVDHVRAAAALVEAILRKAGYDVIRAYDGVEAWEKAWAEHPDMVITEVVLPRLNGMDLSRRMKQDERTEAIPVIFVSARRQDTDKFAALNAGGDSYLTKPFEPQELLTIVQRIFESIDRIAEEGARSDEVWEI